MALSITEPLLGQVSAETASSLLRTFSVRLSTELALPGQEHYPPGAVDYNATFSLTWYSFTTDDPSDIHLLEAIADHGKDADDGIEFTVGHAHLVKVDLGQHGLFDALDARDADLEYLAALLFTERPNGEYEIESELEGFNSDALLVNSAEVDPLWRGHKLGLLGTGTAIKEIGRGCGLVALDAMQPGTRGAPARRASHQRLTSYWSQLGFKPWRERVLILDLALRTFDDHLTNLVSNAGLR
ncbi:hypothetical protein E1263_27530 [Kribbella antibiotica]|uniref:Uncharacterized protein n=1 Tax=Kribbella antibiotica TaxID=190195 RepID=A0A4R4Z6P5_9ACTN|nr:hypothetical protein [Kribbella antibiotica]TDD53848.1 hypothetical protein E1263_27530 [Kribbella antibiotica]